LNALCELNLSKCEGLQELPNTIGDLHAFQKFDLSNCFKIQELLTSIGKLINLQDFNLSRCFALHELPTSIGQLIYKRKSHVNKHGSFEVGSISGSIDDGRSPGREFQRRKNPRAFKSFGQPRIICMKDYESGEENEGDTIFIVKDPFDSPPSSFSLGAKVSKDIVGIGRQPRRINLG
jgi:hypothetical protein